MPSNSRNSQREASRSLIYVGLGIIASIIGVLIFTRAGSGNIQDAGNLERNHRPGNTGAQVSQSQSTASGERDSGPDKTRSSNSRKTGKVDDAAVGHFPLVERIVSDTAIGDREAAARLAEIAQRVDVSLEERYEALAHGLNLDFGSFSNFASEPDLPVELAQRYLDELLNQNKNPLLQIEGCIALLGHSDRKMQSQAAEQLAFLVEKESLVESHEELKKAAVERLDYLKLHQPSESAPDTPVVSPNLDSE